MAGNPPVVDPHLVDEDPEQLMGAVIPDPWDDKTQTDWPQNVDETDSEPAEDSDDEPFVDDRDNVEVID